MSERSDRVKASAQRSAVVRRQPTPATAASLGPHPLTSELDRHERVRPPLRWGGPMRLGGTDDPAEADAERMADAMRAGAPARPAASSDAGTLRRQCAGCGAAMSGDSCPSCEEGVVRRQALSSDAGGPLPLETEEGIRNLQGGGEPLPAGLRERFEGSTGQDLSGVRVHHGPEAARLSEGLGARAFSVGSDVVLGAGAERSEQTLSHEVAHVVQSEGGSATVRRQQGQARDPQDISDLTLEERYGVALGTALRPFGDELFYIVMFALLLVMGIAAVASVVMSFLELYAPFLIVAVTGLAEVLAASFAVVMALEGSRQASEAVTALMAEVDGASTRSELEGAGQRFGRRMAHAVTNLVFALMGALPLRGMMSGGGRPSPAPPPPRPSRPGPLARFGRWARERLDRLFGRRAPLSRAATQLDEIMAAANDTSRPGRDVYREVRDLLVRADALGAAEKADAFEQAIAAINRGDPSWLANRGEATNAAGFFTGDARPFGFAIDLQGRVWTIDNFTRGVQFGGPNVAGTTVTIDYSLWRLHN